MTDADRGWAGWEGGGLVEQARLTDHQSTVHKARCLRCTLRELCQQRARHLEEQWKLSSVGSEAMPVSRG